MKSRDEEIDYAEKHDMRHPHRSKVQALLLRPQHLGQLHRVRRPRGPVERAARGRLPLDRQPPEKAPDEPDEVEIGFTRGVPVVARRQEDAAASKIIDTLNKIGGRHGVGRIDQVENRLVGIKSREVYEAPGAVILHKALRALEALVWTRDVAHFAPILSERYSRLIYDGQWFTTLRENIDAFFDKAHEVSTGTVRVKLYKGSAVVNGRKSDFALYDKNLATYTPEDSFDHTAAEGFIKIWSLPMKGEARQGKLKTRKK